MPLKRFHLGRGSVLGDYHIVDGTIPYTKLSTDTIVLRVVVPGIPVSTGSLPADSTGVKYEGFRFRISKRHLKSAVLRATWTASTTDSVTAIELFDATAGAVRGSVSGNAGTDKEGSISVAGLVDGNLHSIRVNVTTASATAGATVNVRYAVLELVYGVS